VVVYQYEVVAESALSWPVAIEAVNPVDVMCFSSASGTQLNAEECSYFFVYIDRPAYEVQDQEKEDTLFRLSSQGEAVECVTFNLRHPTRAVCRRYGTVLRVVRSTRDTSRISDSHSR
jgi:hypothetical protein